MRIKLDSPYSEVIFTPQDTPQGMERFRKALSLTKTMYVTGDEKEQVPVCLLHDDRYFRTGLWPRISRSAKGWGLSIEDVSDLRKVPTIQPHLQTQHVQLRDYQEVSVCEMLEHSMGVLCAATGAGKTHIAASMIERRAVPTLFLVHTKELLWQTQDRFKKILRRPIGVIGDNEFDIQEITVATVQTLIRQLDRIKLKVDMVIQDETHHIPADMFYRVTANFNAYYVYGLSATPDRADGTDLMIEAAAGPIVSEIRLSDLIARGILARPIIRFVPVPAQTSYHGIMRHVMIARHIVKNVQRNMLIAENAAQLAQQGKSILIAVNQVKHIPLIGEQLTRCQIPYQVLRGADNSTTRKLKLDQLRKKKFKVLISTLMKEGVDIPSLDVVINAAGGSDLRQLIGRALRKDENKETAIIIDFVDYAHIRLLQNSRSRIKQCKTEPEFVVMGG